jgi:hypothetical protein
MQRDGAPPDDAPPSLPPPPGEAAHFTTGLVYQVRRLGERGRHPGPRDQVRAAYRAWGEDGRLLADTGGGVTLSVGELPPGLAEALQAMTPGERGRAWVPPHLAGPGLGSGTTVYDIELVGVTRAEPPSEVPLDLRAPRLDEAEHGDPGG